MFGLLIMILRDQDCLRDDDQFALLVFIESTLYQNLIEFVVYVVQRYYSFKIQLNALSPYNNKLLQSEQRAVRVKPK